MDVLIVEIHTVNSLLYIALYRSKLRSCLLVYLRCINKLVASHFVLLHSQRSLRVHGILVVLRHSKEESLAQLSSIERRFKLFVEEFTVAISAKVVIISLMDGYLLTKDGKTHSIADQVSFALELHELGMLVAITEVADHSLLNQSLLIDLVVLDVNGSLFGHL